MSAIGALAAKFDAFIQALREHHRALGREAQAVVTSLLELRSGERRRREAALFFLRDTDDLPDGVFDRRENALRFGFVRNFEVFTLVLDQLRFKRRRLAGGQERMHRPIFFRDEGADFLLALDDEAQRDGLDASGGKAAANFVPKQRRNFVADEAVEDAAGLLRVDEIFVHLRRMLERGANCFRRDFVEHHAEDFGSGGGGEAPPSPASRATWRFPCA